MDPERFNPNHGAAGSGQGGQFVSAGGGSGGGASGGGKKAAPAGHAHGTPGHGRGSREQLLAQAHQDIAEADGLEKQLQVLERQHKQAAAAAKQSAKQAAAAKNAGHVVHHHHHQAVHHHHHRHAQSIARQISSLKSRIHDLRQHAAELTAKAHAMRAAGMVTNPEGTEKLHEYWVHGEGAAKIGWGAPGDFDRCVLHLSKYVRDPKGYCAKAHHDALGIWPATHAAMEKKDAGRPGMDRAAAKKPYGDVEYADPGYLDANGEQVSKSGKPGVKRYPLTQDKVMAAWSYISQDQNASQYTAEQLAAIKGRIKSAMAKFGHKVSDADGDMNSASPAGEFRTVPFDVASSQVNGDGLTFEGYAAVYGQAARIAGMDEDFDEQIAPGAFRSVTSGKYPVLMFEHGRHPLIGTLPIGRITDARDDPNGLWIEARLTDNWLIQPVRDAIGDRAITGMSFRFTVDGDDGETWMTRSGDVPLRTLNSLSVPELGPVVFPAYEPTTASVRSALDRLPVIGRPQAGARAASDRAGSAPGVRAEPELFLSDRFRRDGEALALRGIQGVRI